MFSRNAVMCANRRLGFFTLMIVAALVQLGCSKEEFNKTSAAADGHSPYIEDDGESEPGLNDPDSKISLGPDFAPVTGSLGSCTRASLSQIAQVNLGVPKHRTFVERCLAETKSLKYCQQIARPNPDSHRSFDCTYSRSQAHVFVHPDEKTWKNAIEAVKIVTELEAKGIKVERIYNWWRPEPYNQNVGGSPTRHPFGTSVDVRFPSKTEQNKAHTQLCKMRAQGRIRAVGYYSGTGLHLGIGDKAANTWGKSCSGGFDTASVILAADHSH